MSTKRLAAACAITVLALGAAACGSDDTSEKDAPASKALFQLEALRDATACPIKPEASKLPDDLELGATGDANVSEYGEGVKVSCEFPIAATPEDEELEVMVVAAPAGTDAFTMESDSGGTWTNSIYNATGVEKDAIEDALEELSGADVAVLEGRGESVAVRRVDVDGAETALLLAYGDDTRTGEELEAVAAAVT